MVNPKTSLLYRLRRRLRLLPIWLYQRLRVWKYKLFSDIYHCTSLARFNQPVLMTGRGRIQLGQCNLGVWPSPYFLSGYMHIEAREPEAEVIIGNGVWINNNASIIAECSRIEIGDNTLIGPEFLIVDSDFHDLHPSRRMSGKHITAATIIGENVFIGARVTILKGVTIGNNSVIASGATVTGDIPVNSIAAGVPARVIAEVIVGEELLTI